MTAPRVLTQGLRRSSGVVKAAATCTGFVLSDVPLAAAPGWLSSATPRVSAAQLGAGVRGAQVTCGAVAGPECSRVPWASPRQLQRHRRSPRRTRARR